MRFGKLVIVLLLCLVVPCALADAGWRVQIAATDGSQLQGTLFLDKLSMKSSLGDVSIEASKIKSIVFGAETDTVVTQSATLKGKVQTAEFKVETDVGTLTLDRSKIGTMTFLGAGNTAGPASAPGPAPAGDPAGAKPKREIPADNELEPIATIPLGATIRDLTLSKDRTWLYFLNTSEGKIQRLNTATRSLDTAVAECTDGTLGMCFSPSRRTIYAYASPKGHDGNNSGDKQKYVGKIHVIDAGTLQIRSTFSAECDPACAVADDKERLYVSGGSGQWSEVTVIDATRKAIVAHWTGIYSGAILQMHPDQKRVYFGTVGISPGDYYCVPIPEKIADRPKSYDSPYHGEYPLGGRFVISPDGRFLLGGSGPVLRLAKTAQDDMKYLSTLEAWDAAAVDEGASFVLVSTKQEMLKTYLLTDFKVASSWMIKGYAYALALDAKQSLAYCAVARTKPQTGGGAQAVGDLCIYALNTKTDTAPGPGGSGGSGAGADPGGGKGK